MRSIRRYGTRYALAGKEPIRHCKRLVSMNETLRLEASRKLAERLIHDSPKEDARLDLLGNLLLARDWGPREKAVLEGALAQYRETYTKDPEMRSNCCMWARAR